MKRLPEDPIRFTVALVVLSASVASVAQAGFLTFGGAGAFATQNNFDHAERFRLLAVLAGSFGIPALAASVFALWRGRAVHTTLRRLSCIVSPLLLTYPIVTLTDYRVWISKPLPFLVLLGLVVLGLERALRSSLEALPTRRWARNLTVWLPAQLRRFGPLGLVVTLATGFSAYVAYFALQQHFRLATAAFDLGIYDNLMYNALHGAPFHSPVLFGPKGGNYLAGHAELAMLLFVPVYAIHPGAETLLVLQSVVLGFAAVPLYMFASTVLPRYTAVLVSASYLLFAPLHGPAFYDFHWLPLAMFFHFWLYYAIARRKTWLIVVCWAILTLIREDVSVGLVLLGLFLVLSKLRPRLGLVMMVVSTMNFILLKFVLMPWAGQWWFADMYKELVAHGERGYGSVIVTLLINPMYVIKTLLEEGKLVYLLHLLAPLAFLPCRRWLLLLLISGGAFFTLLTTGYAPTLSISFQYTTHWIPYLFCAATLALVAIGRTRSGTTRQMAAALAMFVGVTLHSLTFGAVLQRHQFVGGFSRIPFKVTEGERKLHDELMDLIDEIPSDAVVSASDNLVAHVSNRREIYTLRGHHGDAEFLLIDKRYLSGTTRKAVESALDDVGYDLKDKKKHFVLLSRNGTGQTADPVYRGLGLKRK